MSATGRRRPALPVVALLGALVVAACTATTTGSTAADAAGATALPEHLTTTEEYLPGLAADVYQPSGRTTAPLVVVVPGGDWESADRSGRGPLADTLADAGLMAVTITYRTGTDEARFPVPVQDIACALSASPAHWRWRRGSMRVPWCSSATRPAHIWRPLLLWHLILSVATALTPQHHPMP